MKILLVAEDITIFGGAERVVVNLANAFSNMAFANSTNSNIVEGGGNRIEILSLNHKNSDLPFQLNPNIKITYYDFPSHKGDIKAIKGHYKKLCIKLKVLLYKLKFLVKFRRIGTREILERMVCRVVNQNQYDFVIDNTWSNFYSFYRNDNTKYIKILHTSVAFQAIHQPKSFFDRLATFDYLIYPASQIDIWQRYHKSIKVIPNFLPNIPQVATNHSQKVVLSVGRFSSEKGFVRLLDIWKMVRDRISSLRVNETNEAIHKNNESKIDCHESANADSRNDGVANELTEWKLIIVGDGVLKSEIQSKIRALNLGESVILKPFTKDIEREYLRASIYAMASHFEGFPMVLLESTAYGLAPISFDIATGPSDIIEHNKSGFLIPDNDLESYADKLIALMRDESMRIAFGKEAKRIVEKRFSKEVVMRQWEEVFEKN